MRKLLVLAAVAASFSVGAQTQVESPGKRPEANPKEDKQAPVTKTEEERIRAEGAAGGTRPVPARIAATISRAPRACPATSPSSLRNNRGQAPIKFEIGA